MHRFVEDLLTYSKPVESFTYYNSKVKSRMVAIRAMYEAIIGKPHHFTVTFWYATKSDQEPNAKVVQKIDDLKAKVKSLVSSCSPQVETWGARQLTTAFRSPPSKMAVLEIKQHFMCPDGSVVCLAKLDRFAAFLTDEKGALKEYILEPNVRDYGGAGNPVNKDIRSTITSSEIKEFWWLNNGITIVADKVHVAADRAEIESPELVNGLQTSHEIFNYFSKHKTEDPRTILVRVIVPPNEQTRRRIIKATNYQTPVNPLSLRATDDIHFDIEELLKLYGLFYDRRKGQYRRLRKPIAKIISIKEMAQSVIAIVLQRPDDARGRPGTVLGTEQGYEKVFDSGSDREMFLACILLDRQVKAYLNTRDDLSKDTKNDIVFYMDTWLSCHLAQKSHPNKSEIAALSAIAKGEPIASDTMKACCDSVLDVYAQCGGDANAAKSSEMTKMLMTMLEEGLS